MDPQYLKPLREMRGLTQKELAEKCGVSEQQLWKWENGVRNPKPESLRKIADALELTEEEREDLGIPFPEKGIRKAAVLLKEYREERGMTQEILGREIRVSQQMIALWETGDRNPKPESLRKICIALKLTELEWMSLLLAIAPYPMEGGDKSGEICGKD